jgi:inner membrane transporter RhtA
MPELPRSLPLLAVGLVIAGLTLQEVGASFAVFLFPEVGALGVVSLRLGFSAIILLLVCRPKLRGHGAAGWATVTGFGIMLAGMNFLFYEALERIPLGATVTIEVLGPLVLSVVMSRRASSWVWAIVAAAGVALLGRGSFGHLDPVGVLFAFGAAATWAGYILLSARTGSRFRRIDGLAIAMAIGAIVTVPFGVVATGPALFEPRILLLGAAVAVLSSTIPYAFELVALRRLPATTFSILMSLAPAIAALAGLVILGQRFTIVGALAITLVIAASIGAVRSARARPAGGLARAVEPLG